MFMFNCVFTRVYTRCLIADVCTRLTLSEALTNPCSEKRDAWRLRMMMRKMTREEKGAEWNGNGWKTFRWITLIGMKMMQLTDIFSGNNQKRIGFCKQTTMLMSEQLSNSGVWLWVSERTNERCGASERVSGASEWAKAGANGPVLNASISYHFPLWNTSLFLIWSFQDHGKCENSSVSAKEWRTDA